MPPTILICDPLDEVALQVFHRRGLETVVRTGLGEDELAEAAREVQAIVVRSATRVTRRVIEAAGALRAVGRAGIGVDNVDCEAATERGVIVMNTPAGNATTTAEHAIALLLALARHVPLADRRVRAGGWQKKKGLLGTELTGKTLGLIGLGRIGRLVAERARGLRLEVLASDPYLRAGDSSPVPGVSLVDLDFLLEHSDFVSLHVPLLESTRHLLSWERIARMKPGARLVNASRGGVVDEEAVLDALVEGRLAGAAFDVLEEEPPAPSHPFLSRDDVILTPHLGASSSEAQFQVALEIAESVCDFLLLGVARSPVNAPALPAELLRELAPFLHLAERIGSFLAQRLGEPIRKLELTVGGELARHDVGHVQLALLVGVLRAGQASEANFVNAPALAAERGVRVLTSREEDSTYRSGQIKVRASARGGSRSHVVTGAVFGREPRIVRIDGFHLDLAPAGHLLLTRHRDQPGVVGRLGMLLGEHGINIRRIELAPPDEGGESLAAAFLTLYQAPPPEVLQKLAALEAIEEVQLVQLGPAPAGDAG